MRPACRLRSLAPSGTLAYPTRGDDAAACAIATDALRLTVAMSGQGGAGLDRLCVPQVYSDLLAAVARHATVDLRDPGAIQTEGRRLALTAVAGSHLADAMDARNARDLDLAIHHLRSVLTRIDRQSAQIVTPDLRDAALAPVLWRMAVLDQGFDSNLCIGLDRLTRRAGALLARHDGGRILGAAARQRLIASLRDAGAYIAQADAQSGWARALGPAGWN